MRCIDGAKDVLLRDERVVPKMRFSALKIQGTGVFGERILSAENLAPHSALTRRARATGKKTPVLRITPCTRDVCFKVSADPNEGKLHLIEGWANVMHNMEGIMEIRVANKKDGIVGVYVGRGSVLGNPFKMNTEAERARVIQFYRAWLWDRMQEEGPVWQELTRLADLSRTQDLTLVCWCAPKPCHADVIKNAINWLVQRNRIAA
jgi:hypothetical protein